MSSAAPIILIFVLLIGGIVAWGAMTEWTFSGMLPREGAKCTPEKDDKDKNATRYVYDEDEECTIIEKCKTAWKPDTSNTVCEYTNVNKECTANTVYIENVDKYASDIKGGCNLASSCKTGWKPSTDAKSCVGDSGTTCSPPESKIDNAKKYTFGPNGKCTLVKECDSGWRLSDDSKACIDEFEPLTTPEPYQMDGFYEKDTVKDQGQLGKVKTVEECRKLAKTKGGVAIGVRTTKWGKPGDEYHKTCWYNGPTWKPDTSKIVGETGQYTECLDKTKKPSEGCA